MRTPSALILILLATCAFGQVDRSVIKQQAELTARALLQDDYETLIKFTYPKVVEMVGGRAQMISLIKKGKIEMAEQGISFQKVIIGKATAPVNAGDEIHCLIPQTIIMKVPNGKLKSESQLLAVSRDKGVNWFFIDAVSLTPELLKKILPNYNQELKLPAKKQPVFIAD